MSESGFFAREEPIAGLGMAPAAAERAFELKEGEVSEAIRTPQGFAFITVTGTQAARVPALEEVKARVREDVVKKKAVDAARQNAASLAAKLKTGDFTAGAKAANVEVQTTDLIARGAADPRRRRQPRQSTRSPSRCRPAASAIRSSPIPAPSIVKVLEKKDATPAEARQPASHRCATSS